MTPYFLMAAGAVLVLAALALGLGRPGPWLIGLATAGLIAVGTGELAAGAGPGTVVAWGMAAYLGWQWHAAARKAGRR